MISPRWVPEHTVQSALNNVVYVILTFPVVFILSIMELVELVLWAYIELLDRFLRNNHVPSIGKKVN